MTLGGLTLPQILRARDEASKGGESIRPTSVIFVELAGGPSHFETYDPKPDAPSEYRGPLGVAKTNIPGIWLSELMVRQAEIMDKLAIIRSITHDSSSHGTSSHLTQTGYYNRDPRARANSFPSVGSVAAKLKGANADGIQSYVAIPSAMRSGNGAFLGNAYDPFLTGGDPNASNFEVKNVSLAAGLNPDRLEDRRALTESFDNAARLVDNSGVADSIDTFGQQAFDVLLGDRARNAFDISREPAESRDRYGRNPTGQSFLLARRLVEAGSTFVSIRVSSWDDHTKIADRMKLKGPNYDQGLATLISDLYDRGLSEDVLVVAMGEFGRTPRINKGAGRDHWGKAMSVLMSGGRHRMGQVIGETNDKGEEPIASPYRPEHVLGMVYRHLGIDPGMTINDLTGRPRYLLEERKLIRELI